MKTQVKDFTSFVNEKSEKPRRSGKLNEAMPAETEEEILVKLQNNLPELEKIIAKDYGLNVKLTVEQSPESRGATYFYINSNDLLNETGKLGRIMFKNINLNFYCDLYTGDAEMLWFGTKINYQHPSLGSNGVDFYNRLSFNLTDEKWSSEKIKAR